MIEVFIRGTEVNLDGPGDAQEKVAKELDLCPVIS